MTFQIWSRYLVVGINGECLLFRSFGKNLAPYGQPFDGGAEAAFSHVTCDRRTSRSACPANQLPTDLFCGPFSTLISVVAANIDPLPTIACWDPRPAGVIRVVVDRTTKAEREEIPVVEPMMEMIMEAAAPRGAPVPSLDASACDWPCGHRTPRHRSGGHRASMHHRTAHTSSPAHHGGATSTMHHAASANHRRRHRERPMQLNLRPMP
jgi:hypothetical protein